MAGSNDAPRAGTSDQQVISPASGIRLPHRNCSESWLTEREGRKTGAVPKGAAPLSLRRAELSKGGVEFVEWGHEEDKTK